ncbi:MAG: hypothetical protein ACP5JG_12950 [Anaerolineae bacterium]
MVFRRRRFPRRPRRALQNPEVPFAVRRALVRAERARQDGDYVGAAQIYEKLAQEAYAEERLRPGAQMDLEATRAYIEAGDYGQAQGRALHALEAFLDQQRMPRVVMPLVARISDAMISHGTREQAEAFRAKVDDLLAAHGFTVDDLSSPPAPRSSEHRGRLPNQCPSCYAPLHPDEVAWLEPDRAQCTYCGSVVLTE